MGFPNILVVIPNLFPLPSLSHFPFAPVSIYSYSIATPPRWPQLRSLLFLLLSMFTLGYLLTYENSELGSTNKKENLTKCGGTHP